MSIEHRTLGNTASKMHSIVWQSVATQAARQALVLAAVDVGKVVRQIDNGTFWLATTTNAVTGWTEVGLVETSGPTALGLGSIPDNSLLARVGAFLVAAVISAPLLLTAGTLSVNPVSNTSAGVAPAHAGAADVGKALVATSTGSQWTTNFGAQNLTTTGALSLGTSPAATGDLRLPNAFTLNNRNAGNTADVTQITGTGTTLGLGSISVQTTITSANTTTFSLTGGGTLNFNALSGQQLLFNSTAATTFGMTASAAATGFLFTGRGHDSSAVGGTGGARLERAGDATGASGTRTGGAFDIRPGSGASAGGLLRLLTGAGTARLSVNDTGLGLFANAPVAQAARIGQAINSTGVAPSGTRTFVDVTTAALADPAKVNANFSTLVDNMWNLIENAVRNLGVTAIA